MELKYINKDMDTTDQYTLEVEEYIELFEYAKRTMEKKRQKIPKVENLPTFSLTEDGEGIYVQGCEKRKVDYLVRPTYCGSVLNHSEAIIQ